MQQKLLNRYVTERRNMQQTTKVAEAKHKLEEETRRLVKGLQPRIGNGYGQAKNLYDKVGDDFLTEMNMDVWGSQ